MLYDVHNPHGGDIYEEHGLLDFSASTNPLGTPEGVRRAVQESVRQLDRYPDPYCRELVQAISLHEQVPEEYILCGNGAAELIYAFDRAVSPQKAAEPAPTFSEYSLGLADCDFVRFPLKQESGFSLTEEVLPFLKAEKPQVFFLCNPNNPTGKLADFGLLREILQACREENILLFADECFLSLTREGRSLKEFLGEYPELFILKAFTKSYGMAGLRLGYGLSSNRQLLKKMAGSMQPWNVSIPAQKAGIAALKDGKFLQDTLCLVEQERVFLKAELEKLGLWVCDSVSNFLLFQGPHILGNQMKKQKILLRSCENFPGLGPGWYRIAVRTHEENKRLLDTMHQILEG